MFYSISRQPPPMLQASWSQSADPLVRRRWVGQQLAFCERWGHPGISCRRRRWSRHRRRPRCWRQYGRFLLSPASCTLRRCGGPADLTGGAAAARWRCAVATSLWWLKRVNTQVRFCSILRSAATAGASARKSVSQKYVVEAAMRPCSTKVDGATKWKQMISPNPSDADSSSQPMKKYQYRDCPPIQSSD